MSALDIKFTPAPGSPWRVLDAAPDLDGYAVTVLTRMDSQPAGKRFTVGTDGNIIKAVPNHSGRYTAQTVPCANLATLQTIIGGFTEADVLMLAYLPDAAMQSYTIVPQSELRGMLNLPADVRPAGLRTVNGQRYAARLKENFQSSRFLMFDRDIVAGAPAHLHAETRDDFWQQMISLWPELAGAARLIVPSSSNRVAFTDGRRCFNASSEHWYIELTGERWQHWDALRKTLESRAAESGLTFAVSSTSGATLTRSVMDFSVISIGREIFESAPAVGMGLTRLPVNFELIPGCAARLPELPALADADHPADRTLKKKDYRAPCAGLLSAARNPAALTPVAAMVSNAPDGGKHVALNKASYTAGGLVAAGVVTADEARQALRAAIAARRVDSLEDAYATIERGLRDGSLNPLTPDAPADGAGDKSADGGVELGEKSDFNADLSRLRNAPADGAAHMAVAIIRRYGWQSPRRRTFSELAGAVVAALPAGHPATLPARLQRVTAGMEQRARRNAISSTSLDAAALAAAHIRYERVESLDGLSARIAAEPEAVWLVKAPHGAGKTESILKPLSALPGCAVAVTNRVSLVSDLSARLRLKNYQTVQRRELDSLDGLGICLPSVANPKFDAVFGRADIVLIDEISACLRELHSIGGTLKREGPATTRRLSMLLDGAHVACGVDADLGTADVLLLASLLSRPVRVVELPVSDTAIAVEHADADVMQKRLLMAVADGQRCRVACDSSQKTVELAAMIRAQFPEKRVIAIHSRHGDSTAGDPATLRLLTDINCGISDYDVMIHSPTVESGVSLTIPHFDRTFAFFCGRSVAPAGMIQQLRRDRTATRFEIGLSGSCVDSLPTSAGMILTNLEAAHRRTVELASDETGATMRVEPATAWDKAAVAYRAVGNMARNDAAQHLLLMLESRGFAVARVDDGEKLDKETRRAARVDADAGYQNAVLTARLITADERELLESTYQPTPEESAQMERYDATLANGLPADGADSEALRTFAHGRLNRWNRQFDRVTGSATPAAAVERDADDALVPQMALHRNELAVIEAVQTFFEVAGFDRHTGAGEVSADGAMEVFDNLRASPCRPALESAGIARFNRTPKYPVRWLSGALSSFGLTLEVSGESADRRRVYRIAMEPTYSADGLTCKAPGWLTMRLIQQRRLNPADAAINKEYIAPCAGQNCDTFLEVA